MSGYDRDAVVAALRALYETIAAMADITLEVLQQDWQPPETTKSAAVLDLMRHLPRYSNSIQLAPNTWPVDYISRNWIGTYIPFDPFGENEADVNKDEIVLTMQDDNNGSILILDTLTGQARTVEDTMSRPDCPRHSAETCPPLCRYLNPEQGAILDILDLWQDRYLSLIWQVSHEDTCLNIDRDGISPHLFQEMTAVYRSYGWPDNYQGSACREALGNLEDD